MSNRVWINSFQMEEEEGNERREMEFSLYETEKFQCNISRLIGADNLQWIFLLTNGTRMPALVASTKFEDLRVCDFAKCLQFVIIMRDFCR